MKKLILIAFLSAQLPVFAQDKKPEIFSRIAESMRDFKIDTSAVPNDKLSAKIKELRSLKGGFNINEAMEYKMAEARSKNELTEVEYEEIKKFLVYGNGRKWLDNAVAWIYRNHFTADEISETIKFYKTSAGKKMANDFPIIMAQSMYAAEAIMGKFKKAE